MLINRNESLGLWIRVANGNTYRSLTSATVDSAKCGRIGGHEKSIGNVIKSFELRSILLEKYLSTIRCTLLMANSSNSFQRQGKINQWFIERKKRHKQSRRQLTLFNNRINDIFSAFKIKNMLVGINLYK